MGSSAPPGDAEAGAGLPDFVQVMPCAGLSSLVVGGGREVGRRLKVLLPKPRPGCLLLEEVFFLI